MVKVKIKTKPGQQLKPTDIPGYVEALQQALTQLRQTPDDIQTIIDAGIGPQHLSKLLGIHRSQLWRWRKGLFYPPAVFVLTLKALADHIRDLNTSNGDNNA